MFQRLMPGHRVGDPTCGVDDCPGGGPSPADGRPWPRACACGGLRHARDMGADVGRLRHLAMCDACGKRAWSGPPPPPDRVPGPGAGAGMGRAAPRHPAPPETAGREVGSGGVRLGGRARPARHPAASAYPLDDDLVLYRADPAEAFVLNATGARVWELCDGMRTAAAVARQVALEYGLPRRRTRADVAEILGALAAAGLLVTGGA